MNKTVQFIIKLIVVLAFLGVLLSIAFDIGGRIELICCAIATVGVFVLFKQKKKRSGK